MHQLTIGDYICDPDSSKHTGKLIAIELPNEGDEDMGPIAVIQVTKEAIRRTYLGNCIPLGAEPAARWRSDNE
jgi:hypothetical protein